MPDDQMALALRKVAATLPGGGEERPGQAEMAQAVLAAVESERHLVVQAGTGTGKSLGYLVPAVLSGRKVVVATATKALQDQLAQKDLPTLARGLGRPVSFAVLKGRRNYLCLERASEVSGGGFQQTMGTGSAGGNVDAAALAAEPSEPTTATATGPVPAGEPAGLDPDRLAGQVVRLLDWAGQTTTGDVAELDFEPHPRAWAMLSVGPQECPGAARCPQGAECFAERARQRAAEADVVVVNTHLYGAHLASAGAVLPAHEVVVFDEAHELEEVMTASLGVEVSPGRLSALHALARPLLDPDRSAAADLGEVAERLRPVLTGLVGSRVLQPARARHPEHPVDPSGRERAFFAPPTPAAASGAGDAELSALLELATSRVERLRAQLLDGTKEGAATGDADTRRLRALAAAGHLADDLGRFGAVSVDEVSWVESNGRSPMLRLSPVDVGPSLAGSLWGTVTAVLTSATVPPGMARRVGLDAFDVDELDVGSPFDYRAQSMLYVARHLPDPRHERYEAAALEELAFLIGAAGGRTLALFTSRRATEAAAAAMRERLDFTVLVQGERPKSRLLEQFAEEETSCLFATLSFWQGVDIPGRALSLVVLDKLPFGRPDDPLLVARRERAGDRAFSEVDIPRAATLLAQGVGRLIRSGTDAGVVAVLDRRLATAGYRRALLDALPPMRRSVERTEVAAFLTRVLTTGA